MALGRGPCDTTGTIKKPDVEMVFQWIKTRSDSGFKKSCISDEMGGGTDEERDENTDSECESETDGRDDDQSETAEAE
jgi:hypothetical protein